MLAADAVPGSRFVMSRDVTEQGAKEFVAFASVRAVLAFVKETSRRNCNEVVERADAPVRMFFDIDRGDKAFTAEAVARAFLAALDLFLKDIAGVDAPPMRPGATCQVADATSPTRPKTSLHIVASLVVTDMLTHRALACAMGKFVLQHTARFPELCVNDHETVIDVGVYTKFRSFRMLGMHKLGKGADTALRAFLGSSSALRQHLVGVYRGAGALQHHGKEVDLRRLMAAQPDGGVRAAKRERRYTKLLVVREL